MTRTKAKATPITAKVTQRQDRLDNIASALAHPLRRRLLQMLNRTPPTDNKGWSPSELADRLDEKLTNTSYHMRELAAKQLIEVIGTEPRRGAVEHYYALTDDGKMSLNVLQALEGAV